MSNKESINLISALGKNRVADDYLFNIELEENEQRQIKNLNPFWGAKNQAQVWMFDCCKQDCCYKGLWQSIELGTTAFNISIKQLLWLRKSATCHQMSELKPG